jgi:hypothetical protein
MYTLNELQCNESLFTVDIPPPSHKPPFPPLERWQYTLNESEAHCLNESDPLIHKLENLTHIPVPDCIRRGLVLHSQLDKLLNEWTQSKEPFYVLISRGIRNTHLGHLPAFQLARWFQKAFHCPVILQMTDDKAFMYTNDDVSLDDIYPLIWKTALEALSSVSDPFDMSNTFVYSTMLNGSRMYYPTACRVWRSLTNVEAKVYTGVQQTENVGRLSSLGMSIAPLMSEAFPTILGNRYQNCLRIGGVELSSHLCLARRIPHDRSLSNYLTPRIQAGLFTQYVPSITNQQTPMHDTTGGIFLHDSFQVVTEKLRSTKRQTLLQLLWFFGEGRDSTLDSISWEMNDQKVLELALDAVWSVVQEWKARFLKIDHGMFRFVLTERSLTSSESE